MTLRLLALAEQHWAMLDGWSLAHGIDLEALPVDRFVNVVRYWATRGASSDADVKKFEAALWRPPAGVVPDQGPWSPAEENRAFASLKSALGRA